jgi:two-component system CheB/CheR fusion protein
MQREYVEQTFEIDSDVEEDSRWLKVSIFPVIEGNEVIGTGVIISDVTAHIRKEQDLSLAIRVFNEGHQAIMVTDASQKIIQVNQAFEEITGYEILEVIGKTPSILRSGKHDHEFYKRLWLHVNNEGYWEGEIINKRKNGEVYVQWISISAYPKFATRPTNYIAVFNDISEKKAQQDEINKLAFYDTLTGCGNRRCLERDIVKVLTATSPVPFCLIFIDLDYFKLVNDVHGHDIGDKLLTLVTHRFENTIRQEDQVYRLGGDEFVIILKNVPLERVGIISQKLIQSASTPFFIDQNKIFISASLGIASYPQDGGDFLTLLKHADTALYEAKEGGRKQFKFFEPCILESVERKVSLEKGLHEAFDKNELILFVQPQLGFTNKELVRAEVLLRWQSTEFGNVSPIEFIPVAERTGLIHKITQFVLSRTIELLKEFEKENLQLSMNMSALDVKDLEFFENIKMALQQENFPTERLTIELTESVFIDNLELVESHLTELSQLGVKISIDDFGTGYSSLGYLQQLPISEIKIDKKFTYNVDSIVKNQHICKAINSLAHSFDFACVAEGVETQAQYDWLKSIACDFSQGYLHAKPMSIEKFRLFVTQFRAHL